MRREVLEVKLTPLVLVRVRLGEIFILYTACDLSSLPLHVYVYAYYLQ